MISNIKLPIIPALLATLFGCANQSTHLKLNEKVTLPDQIAKGQTAIYVANIKFNVTDAMVKPTAEIVNIEIPKSDSFAIKILDAKYLSPCWDISTNQGYQFTLNNNECSLVFQLSGSDIENINDSINVSTKLENLGVPISHQVFNIPIKTEVMEQNSKELLNIEISPINVGVDVNTAITIKNTNDTAVNNLKIKVPEWLQSYIHIASTDSVYSLEPNERFTYSFSLKQGNDTLNMLKNKESEFTNNTSFGVIEVSAANIKKTYKPNINLILEPATLSDVIFESNSSEITQAAKFYNQSNAVIKVTKVDSSDIPQGINVFAAVCLAQQVIAPNETCSIMVTNESITKPIKIPLTVHYQDQYKNNFSVSSIISVESK